MAINRQPGQVRFTKAEALAVTATGPAALFSAVDGLPVRVEIWGDGAYAVQIERSIDNGQSWLPLTAGGVNISSFAGPVSEFVEDETQRGARYRANVLTYASGTLNIRLSQ